MSAHPVRFLRRDGVERTNLLDLDREGMRAWFVELGEKRFRADQVLKWIYHHGVTDFEAMTNIARSLRAKLSERAEIRPPQMLTCADSVDGTRKWLFRLDGGNSIECVFIPEDDRNTLCISTQVGCALDCSFCATARAGFNRNLTTAEIVGQVWLANRSLLADHPQGDNGVTNVVLMGMGEPLLNLKAVVPALKLMTDDLGFGLSKRRVTVSTSGVVPKMDRLRELVDVGMAVSLHAPNDELRNELVPLNRSHPIAELMAACWRWVGGGDRRKHIMFEYVMLDGVNDRPEHARQLAELIGDLPSKVNLIPFNPFPGSGYHRSPQPAIDEFRRILNDRGIFAITRRTRGDDIDAACGQLAGQVEDRSKRWRRFEQPRFGERVS
ncbi:MAG: 23S rRNA (adenine(2503)-C(2))-methyltransferase RlmN [Halofilum sp. (in: g-proteobacteria)]|nr:23S rRNA (adenine(2503)-C(2))-methyltransferase RlmN [Halofilum sp. (in: g-proteobacteria)]